MSKTNDTIKLKKNQYHHLKKDDSSKIQSLIENYTVDEINNICHWMNNYSRKILNYFTPQEMLQKELNNQELFDKIINIQKAINV